MNENQENGENEPGDVIIKGMDLRIVELNTDIVAAINKANLPAKVLEYVFADYLNVMRSKASAAVADQMETYQKEVDKIGSKHSTSNN